MIDLRGLQYGICAGASPLDFKFRDFEATLFLALFARRLVEFIFGISIEFGFGFFGIRISMAGPVIAIGFGERSEAGWQRGSLLLVI